MTFLAPGWLLAAAAAMAGVVALHFLARQRPARLQFPTARFVPDQPVTAPSPARRPTDLLLLALRLLVVALIGLALAQPVRDQGRRIDIVLLDRSRLAPEPDSALTARLRRADSVVEFGAAPSHGRGSLSAALVAGFRAAAGLASPGDSVTLAIVSPFRSESFDEATLVLRSRWTGRIELVPVASLEGRPREAAQLPADDPLSATLVLIADSVSARLRRESPSPEDTAWARSGGTLVSWPRDLEQRDSSLGLSTSDIAVVARFARGVPPDSGTPLALWLDGSPAATELPLGDGCVRSVTVPVPDHGDLPLRPSFVRFAAAMLAPCGGDSNPAPAAQSLLDSLRGAANLSSHHVTGRGGEEDRPFDPGLLLVAGVLYAVEPLVRRWTGGR